MPENKLRKRERERKRYRENPKARSTKRGYSHAHRELRKRVALAVERGLAVCARCSKPIAPGEPWDLGHVDGGQPDYRGPEHRRCNRATASRERRKLTSREW